jgi:multiple sugar transport system substrate-binding protein
VSAFSQHQPEAIDFAQWVVSGRIQRTLYVQHGGQPGHRSAWLDKEANVLTNDFFFNILPVMENGYMRPRYNGYLYFQDHAGAPLRECLLNDSEPEQALEKMNQFYQESLVMKKLIVA